MVLSLSSILGMPDTFAASTSTKSGEVSGSQSKLLIESLTENRVNGIVSAQKPNLKNRIPLVSRITQSPLAPSPQTKSDPTWAEGTVQLLTITASAGGHSGPVRAVAFHPNSQYFATGSADKQIKFWNLASKTRIRILSQDTDVLSLAFSPDGRWLASGSLNGVVRIWDWQMGQLAHTLTGHEGIVPTVTFTPDSQQLISAGADRTLKVWQVKTGSQEASIPTSQFIQAIVLDPTNPQRIASAGLGRSIEIWNWREKQRESVLERVSSSIYAIAWNPNGQQIAFSPNSSSENRSGNAQRNTITLKNLRRGRAIDPLQGHTDYISFLEYSPSGQTLISGSWDRTIKLWNTSNGRLVRSFLENDLRILAGDFSPNGKSFAIGSGDGTVKVYQSQ